VVTVGHLDDGQACSSSLGNCLGKCEGDCDHNDHCETGLVCWFRDSWSHNIPPGCSGRATDYGIDYCYDPEDRIETVDKGNTVGLFECEGDCDSDNDCIGNLKCWQRGSWGSDLPPGCKGSKFWESHDFCYDPANPSSNSRDSGSPFFGHDLVDVPSTNLFGDHVFEIGASSFWMIMSIVFVIVLSVIVIAILCRGSSHSRKIYKKVAMQSDSEFEAEKLNENEV